MKRIEISVIVPVYNTEAYLHKCIDSILNQSFTNFELLLIDDGSTDKSGQICDEYAKKDFRVKVFHKNNGGVSSARNIGLNNAKGQWVTFIDSDDTVQIDFFSMFQPMEDADLKIQGTTIIEDSQEILLNIETLCVVGHKECLDYYKKIDEKNCLLTQTPWGKLFKKSIIEYNEIKFDESVRVGEDFLFNTAYLLHVHKIISQAGNGYCYLRDNSVLTKTVLAVDQQIELLILQSPYIDQIYKINKNVGNYIIHKRWSKIFRAGLRYNYCLKKEINKILLLFRRKKYSKIANLFRFPYNTIVYTCYLPIKVQQIYVYCIFYVLNIMFPRGK